MSESGVGDRALWPMIKGMKFIILVWADDFNSGFEMIGVMPQHAMMIHVVPTWVIVLCGKHVIVRNIVKIQQDIAIAKTDRVAKQHFNRLPTQDEIIFAVAVKMVAVNTL